MDIISVNFETGAVTGSIDKFWDETHIVREDKVMSRLSVDKDAFVAAVQEGKNLSELSRQFNISWPTAKNYIKKYCTGVLSENGCCEDARSHIKKYCGGDEVPAGIASTGINSDDEQYIREALGDDVFESIQASIIAANQPGTDINVGTIETIEIIGKTVFAPSAGKGENIQDPSSNLPPVITTANQADHDIVLQTTADEPDTECPADVADTNVGNMDEPKEISVQCAIEWRDELDEEIEHVNRLLCPNGPASEIMTYRIELGLKEIRAEFEQQIKRINAVLGETRVRI